jgi:DNA mismatch endonuclease, patch repair protein
LAKLTKEQRSRLMAKVRSRGNLSTEVPLAKALRRSGVTGWRRHRPVRLEGRVMRPDFVFPDARLVVLVHGCFWHGCPIHGTRPKSRRSYWLPKLDANKARDRRDGRALRKQGWKVVQIWEHNIRYDVDRCIARILRRLGKSAKVPTAGASHQRRPATAR